MPRWWVKRLYEALDGESRRRSMCSIEHHHVSYAACERWSRCSRDGGWTAQGLTVSQGDHPCRWWLYTTCQAACMDERSRSKSVCMPCAANDALRSPSRSTCTAHDAALALVARPPRPPQQRATPPAYGASRGHGDAVEIEVPSRSRRAPREPTEMPEIGSCASRGDGDAREIEAHLAGVVSLAGLRRVRLGSVPLPPLALRRRGALRRLVLVTLV